METTKHKVGRVLLIITLIIAFLGCMLMAVTLPFLSTVRVASADSTNGIVEDNLLNQSEQFTYLSSDWTYNASIVSFSDGILTFNNTLSSSQYPFQALNYTASVNDIITLSIYITDIVQPAYFWIRNVSATRLSGNTALSLGLNTITYRINSAGVPQFAFSIDSHSKISIKWMKAELGSSFTGYVPKSYGNYGYNQGYVDASEVAQENFAITGGYKLLGSLEDFHPMIKSTIFNTTDVDGLQYNEGGVNNPTKIYFTNNSKDYGCRTYTLTCTVREFDFEYICYNYNNSFIPTILIAENFVFDGLPLFLTINSIDTITSICLVNSSGYVTRLQVQNLVLTNINGVNAYEIPQSKLIRDDKYSLYVSGSDVSTDLTLNCRSIYGGMGYYALYSQLDGYQVGTDAYARGYHDGKASVDTGAYQDYGYRQGYAQGHTDGVAEYQDYTFLGLISAVIDAPVKAFSGLLEFEILGVNMKNFILGLLTLAVIIIIIKIALGGK